MNPAPVNGYGYMMFRKELANELRSGPRWVKRIKRWLKNNRKFKKQLNHIIKRLLN